ncbi:MAG: tetratricopeptide repeat protein [Gammaproteobacteria bacterium]
MKKLTGIALFFVIFAVLPVTGFSDEAVTYQVEAIAADKLTEAERELQAILAKDPNDPYALLNLAYVYQKNGNQAGAREVYNRILSLQADPYAELASGRTERVKSIARRGMARAESD